MYDLGTKVWVKSIERLGVVTERNYVGKPRKAAYLVKFTDLGGGNDFLTGPHDLRRADFCCDGCSRWLPSSSFPPEGHGPEGMGFCFLCVKADKEEFEKRRYEEYEEVRRGI